MKQNRTTVGRPEEKPAAPEITEELPEAEIRIREMQKAITEEPTEKIPEAVNPEPHKSVTS